MIDAWTAGSILEYLTMMKHRERERRRWKKKRGIIGETEIRSGESGERSGESGDRSGERRVRRIFAERGAERIPTHVG